MEGSAFEFQLLAHPSLRSTKLKVAFILIFWTSFHGTLQREDAAEAGVVSGL